MKANRWTATVYAIILSLFLNTGCADKEKPVVRETARPVKIMTVAGDGSAIPITLPAKTRAISGCALVETRRMLKPNLKQMLQYMDDGFEGAIRCLYRMKHSQ